jgi:uncharacterized protein YndB with AHSA1/START domain
MKIAKQNGYKTDHRKDRGFQIGVRRTLPLSKEQAWAFLTSSTGLHSWLGELASLPMEPGHRYLTQDGTSGEVRVVKPLEQLRLTWQRQDWPTPSTLQIRLLPAGPDKTTISFHQEKLEDMHVREEMKLRWEEVLSYMKAMAEKIEPSAN